MAVVTENRRQWDCLSSCSRNAPPLFSNDGPHERSPRVKLVMPKEAESFCGTEWSDRSKESPPEFREEPVLQVDLQAPATSSVQNSEMYSSCAHEPSADRVIQSHRDTLRRRFEQVREGAEGTQNNKVLDQTYTELYITEGWRQGVDTQHEVRQLGSQLKRNATNDHPIRVHDIFRPLPPDDKPVRVVLTSGVAGVGKTFSVWKFCLEWAKAAENQDLDLVVPLFFRELNLLQQKKLSLQEMVRDFHPDLTHQTSSKILTQKRIIFILDGLDESRLPLNFRCEQISDITVRAEVNTLLVNLLRGTLLPSALIWMTSRPAAVGQIPSWCVDRVTEVRGFFTDAQKKEFFSRRFTDERQCKTILSHIRVSHSLYTMCQIPVFCWITASVLEHMLETPDTEFLPQTLTHMYAHFLLVLTRRRRRKYGAESRGPDLTEADCDTLLKLGRLAFEQLQKGNLMFYREDLQEVGLDVTDASYSGLCTEIFKEESTIFQKSVFSFIHLSVQEFLAAVYMQHCFTYRKVEVLEWFGVDDDDEEESDEENQDKPVALDEYLEDFLKRALLISFESETGHLDLFVRFLHGLCLESNRKPLWSLLGCEWVEPGTLQKAQNQLKNMKIRFECPNRGINIFHCLLEMNDNSVQQKIQDFVKNGDRSLKLYEIHCSALADLIQASEEVMDELDISQYNASPDARLRLIPAVKNCHTARLSQCLLSKAHYELIVLALGSERSPLRTLDLRGNWLEDSGLEILCVGLNSTNCRLETLLLANCRLTRDSCKMLAQVLEKSSLKELDLSRNLIGDNGLQMLCFSLKRPQGALHTLRLTACDLTSLCCSSLASVFESGSALKSLEMNENKLQDSGVALLASGLKSPLCKLETMSLTHCELTEQSCSYLPSVLSSSPLTHLNLSYNGLQDSGVRLLSLGLQGSRLQALRLRCCLLTADGVQSLTSVLKETQLKKLDLSLNRLRDQAVGPLRDALLEPHSLHKLRLKDCGMSREGCESLLSTFHSNPQNLKQLDLHLNYAQVSLQNLQQ
ncbi:hypothetical protein NL108_006166 [Boleophthalmus pectinirostris]|uniref:NACHT, LRR and PYD domains-containing protein 12-like isoform X2 n=1 Tax=Boleophthalmus pectinirostris TaxID=150288 RepID=UPI00242CE2D8|nr:NACHT, LRR and PYD domains-containing protein 12-like isoform X2 [Boleophthalmus pectinirostris]KAJ0060262.1 hypothetical protein NL108_006166 [Boleophthalmus pectinirostris]